MDQMQLSPGGDADLPITDKRKNALLLAAGVLLLALVFWGVSQIKFSGGAGKPKQQTVKITLPSTPPPPPPKQEEKRPEPKQDNKPQQQQEQRQQPAPAEPAPLKMEGAAGNGPSAFQSGGVTNDYTKGAVNTGPGGGLPSADERRKSQFYVNNIKRVLKEELERHLETDERQLEVTFSLWISPDGRLSRFELVPTGNERADNDARRALEETAKNLRLEKPGDVIQPLRMKLTLLPLGQ